MNRVSGDGSRESFRCQVSGDGYRVAGIGRTRDNAKVQKCKGGDGCREGQRQCKGANRDAVAVQKCKGGGRDTAARAERRPYPRQKGITQSRPYQRYTDATQSPPTYAWVELTWAGEG